MASIHMTWRRAVSLILMLLIVSAGCSDSQLTSQGYDEEDELRPRATDAYFMVPAGSRELEGAVTEAVDIEVYLYERASGDPASNRQVQFQVLEAAADAPTLEVGAVMTNANGSASVKAYLGTQVGEWTIRAFSESSNGVEFTVSSHPTETGSIAVELVNIAPTIMTLTDIDVRVYRNDRFSCQYFQPHGFVDEDFLAEGYSPFTEETVVFDELGTRNRYVVTAAARGTHGQIAAGGCVDNILVEHEQTTNVEMLLQLIPLNPSGRYDAVSHWDFTEALADSGSVGAIIVRVLNVFDNPGRAIYDEIINLVRNFFGGIVSGSIDTFLSMTGLDNTFQNLINNFIDGNDVLRQIRDAGRDLRDVVANLQVHSQLSIGKLASDFEFRGQDNWIGLTLYWRWNCGPNDGPDCGAINLVPEADGTFAGLGILSSNWTGRVVAYDQMQVDQHPVSLRYGRLIIYVINDVILPTVTNGNANSLSEAFAYWIGCEGIANSLIPDGERCALGACIRADQVKNFCDSAVSTIFSFADLLIEGLEFDMGLRLGGSARLLEEDSDGVVDRLDQGLFEGFIEGDGGQQSSRFTATWEAVRAID